MAQKEGPATITFPNLTLVLGPRVGMADEVGSTNVTDSEPRRGAAKPDGVIHRYIFNRT